eukprot:scaffold23_cov268-Pinguiococcus_pyrenoidosus.AAC.1
MSSTQLQKSWKSSSSSTSDPSTSRRCSAAGMSQPLPPSCHRLEALLFIHGTTKGLGRSASTTGACSGNRGGSEIVTWCSLPPVSPIRRVTQLRSSLISWILSHPKASKRPRRLVQCFASTATSSSASSCPSLWWNTCKICFSSFRKAAIPGALAAPSRISHRRGRPYMNRGSKAHGAISKGAGAPRGGRGEGEVGGLWVPQWFGMRRACPPWERWPGSRTTRCALHSVESPPAPA